MIDDRDFTYSSDAEWDRADARLQGELNPEKPYVKTNRDVWHVNPFWGKYDKHGRPLQKEAPFKVIPHPEDIE